MATKKQVDCSKWYNALLVKWFGTFVECEKSPTTYHLNVLGGSGSGDYPEGTSVTVVASPPTSGLMFKEWITDIAILANPQAATTIATIPNYHCRIDATYKPIPPSTVTLTVNNGTGSGAYTPNQIVPIIANAPPSGQTFDKWTGDTAGISNPNNPTTSIHLSANAVITATYKATPPSPVYVFVNGDIRDKATQEIWRSGVSGFSNVRLSTDDQQNLNPRGVPCKGPWYPTNPASLNNNVLCQVLSNGDVRVACADQVSPITGLKYHMFGVMIGTTQPTVPLTPGNDITIPRAQQFETLRLMFATIQ